MGQAAGAASEHRERATRTERAGEAARETACRGVRGAKPLGLNDVAKLSDYVIRFLADQGIRHVFLVTGGGAMHLNESLARETRLEAICNSHEQASAICAEIYGKTTNNLGAAVVTTGPGGTNAVTGVAGAWLDSTPCIYVSGQVKRPDRMFDAEGKPLGMRQLGVQEVDIVSIVKPITKYAVTVLDPQSIRYHMEKAAYIARTGRPGPVGRRDRRHGRRRDRGAESVEAAVDLRRQRHPPVEGGARVRRPDPGAESSG